MRTSFSNHASSPATRREALKLTALGGVVFASHLVRGIAGCGGGSSGASAPPPGSPRGAREDFFFLQLSDPHWGFKGPKVNPESAFELPSAVASINAAAKKPDFVIFTGDLTHNSDDGAIRRTRMTEFKQIAMGIEVGMVKFMPGEHDAGDDGGAAFREMFGETNYSFNHKGIHFIALDNVSDPTANLGATQLSWLAADLAPLDADAPIVVFTHRRLWALRADWDWITLDGQKAIDMLMPFHNVTVFFGHIHQELHYMTGHIPHYAGRSLMFALPTPDTDADVPTPLPWNPAEPNAGLGYRSIGAAVDPGGYRLTEMPLLAAAPMDAGSIEPEAAVSSAAGDR